MYSVREKSKASYLPELEEPSVARVTTRLTAGSVEITGFRDGGLSLARLTRAKYVAIVLIGVLAAMLSLS